MDKKTTPMLKFEELANITAKTLIDLHRKYGTMSGVARALKTWPATVSKLMTAKNVGFAELHPQDHVFAVKRSDGCRNLACAVLNKAFEDAATGSRLEKDAAYAFLQPRSQQKKALRDFWCLVADRDPARIDSFLSAMVRRRKEIGQKRS